MQPMVCTRHHWKKRDEKAINTRFLRRRHIGWGVPAGSAGRPTTPPADVLLDRVLTAKKLAVSGGIRCTECGNISAPQGIARLYELQASVVLGRQSGRQREEAHSLPCASAQVSTPSGVDHTLCLYRGP